MEARREMGIDTGTRFLVFGHLKGNGLVFVKVEAVQEMLNMAAEKIEEVAKALQDASERSAEEDKGKRRPTTEHPRKGEEPR